MRTLNAKVTINCKLISSRVPSSHVNQLALGLGWNNPQRGQQPLQILLLTIAQKMFLSAGCCSMVIEVEAVGRTERAGSRRVA